MSDKQEHPVFGHEHRHPHIHDSESVDPKAPVANPENVDLSKLAFPTRVKNIQNVWKTTQ